MKAFKSIAFLAVLSALACGGLLPGVQADEPRSGVKSAVVEESAGSAAEAVKASVSTEAAAGKAKVPTADASEEGEAGQATKAEGEDEAEPGEKEGPEEETARPATPALMIVLQRQPTYQTPRLRGSIEEIVHGDDGNDYVVVRVPRERRGYDEYGYPCRSCTPGMGGAMGPGLGYALATQPAEHEPYQQGQANGGLLGAMLGSLAQPGTPTEADDWADMPPVAYKVTPKNISDAAPEGIKAAVAGSEKHCVYAVEYTTEGVQDPSQLNISADPEKGILSLSLQQRETFEGGMRVHTVKSSAGAEPQCLISQALVDLVVKKDKPVQDGPRSILYIPFPARTGAKDLEEAGVIPDGATQYLKDQGVVPQDE